MIVGLNNDGYVWDFRHSYFPLQHVETRAALGMAGEIKQRGAWGKDEWASEHCYAGRFNFDPAIVLRSTTLINWKSKDAVFISIQSQG